jgi:hypothetical protein
VEGCGTVSPDFAGTSFKEADVVYTITAKPCAGYEFAAWTGSIGANSATLTFTMRPGLALEAHFVPAQFFAAASFYSGLFYDTNGVTPQSSGAITIRTTPKGHFSGTLQMGRHRYPFSGKFDSNGLAQIQVRRENQSPLKLELQVDTTPGAGLITGFVTDDTWKAELIADKAGSYTKENPAPEAGRFHMVISVTGSTGAAAAEMLAGNGHGNLVVEKSGRVHLTGALPDGTKLNQAAALSGDGQWGLYVPLYGGKGSALGWVSFTGVETNALSGQVIWTRPALAGGQNGFTIQSTVSASRYNR